MKFVRIIDGKKVKKATPRADGRIVVILDEGHGVQGKVRVFRDGDAYERALQKVPIHKQGKGA